MKKEKEKKGRPIRILGNAKKAFLGITSANEIQLDANKNIWFACQYMDKYMDVFTRIQVSEEINQHRLWQNYKITHFVGLMSSENEGSRLIFWEIPARMETLLDAYVWFLSNVRSERLPFAFLIQGQKVIQESRVQSSLFCAIDRAETWKELLTYEKKFTEDLIAQVYIVPEDENLYDDDKQWKLLDFLALFESLTGLPQDGIDYSIRFDSALNVVPENADEDDEDDSDTKVDLLNDDKPPYCPACEDEDFVAEALCARPEILKEASKKLLKTLSNDELQAIVNDAHGYDSNETLKMERKQLKTVVLEGYLLLNKEKYRNCLLMLVPDEEISLKIE